MRVTKVDEQCDVCRREFEGPKRKHLEVGPPGNTYLLTLMGVETESDTHTRNHLQSLDVCPECWTKIDEFIDVLIQTGPGSTVKCDHLVGPNTCLEKMGAVKVVDNTGIPVTSITVGGKATEKPQDATAAAKVGGTQPKAPGGQGEAPAAPSTPGGIDWTTPMPFHRAGDELENDEWNGCPASRFNILANGEAKYFLVDVLDGKRKHGPFSGDHPGKQAQAFAMKIVEEEAKGLRAKPEPPPVPRAPNPKWHRVDAETLKEGEGACYEFCTAKLWYGKVTLEGRKWRARWHVKDGMMQSAKEERDTKGEAQKDLEAAVAKGECTPQRGKGGKNA